ncbi:MAG TPA: dynamin family protein [Terriglobia bacterium]|nr:dynamin family protein [Terriglobia bacterium]
MTLNAMSEDRTLTSPAPTSEMGGAQRLLRLAAVEEELGARRLSDEARDLAARVSEGRFYVSCIGQFKRGKSTLINALIGEAVLPSGFIPVTTVPTIVRYGAGRMARIQRQDRGWQEINLSDLNLYVSEEHNPENVKRIAGVEVFVPAPLLAEGMCLVDTPGLGSVFAGNTEATQAFLPRIDAALVVVGADPPLAGEELRLVEAVGRQVRDVILVLNKADRTTDAERAAAIQFTRQLLEKRLHRQTGPVFEVSAIERLENHGPGRDWGKLIEALNRLVLDSGRQIVREACERGIERFSEQLLAIVAEERDALRRPVEESERQVAAMRETIAAAERSMREMGFLFMAEQQRLSDAFVSRHKAFLNSAAPQAKQEFGRALREASRGMGPSYRRRILRKAQQIVHKLVMPWLETEQEEAEREYRQVTRRFVGMGNDFLKKLAEAGVRELARMPHALDADTGFQVRSHFTFRDLIEVAEPASPLRWLADLFLGVVRAHRVIDQSAVEFLIRLLEINSTRVQSDILNRVQESRNRLEVEIRKLLHEVSRIAEQALSHARAAQEAGAPAVQAALARLDDLEQEIRNLSQQP